MSKNTIYNIIAKTAHYWALGPGQGIAFGQNATPVTLAAEYSAANYEITPAQLEQLKADPFLVVVEGSGAVASDDATRALQAQLQAAQDDSAALKVQLAALSAELAERTTQRDNAEAALVAANNKAAKK